MLLVIIVRLFQEILIAKCELLVSRLFSTVISKTFENAVDANRDLVQLLFTVLN